jgi:hypothetical protein
MTDGQIIISILSAIFLLIIVVINFTSLQVCKMYKKKYSELERGVYKFEPSVGHQCYFYLHSYDINSVSFTRTNVNIIFFPDGDIKLSENVYIHKWQIWTSFVIWYYYRKFHKLKDKLISDYNFSQAYRRMSENRDGNYQNIYIKKHNSPFKFLRG